MANEKLVYRFGRDETDGCREDVELLGGKGANLAEMCRIGLPVPPGFTISTEACVHYLREGESPPGLWDQVTEAIRGIESETGKAFGASDNPLLLSVRSGAALSMPGMMDTVLNLGLNDTTAEALAAASDNRRFAMDSYRRFVQMYGDVVLAIPAKEFEELLEAKKRECNVEADHELPAEDLEDLVRQFKDLVLERTGKPFPEDPSDQLLGSVEAVFRSWNADRARAYRRIHRLSDDLGTAVNVMAMVYGNMGEDSGTGVIFTRDPGTGEKRLYGEFLVNAQGEDVVAGVRDPKPIEEMAEHLPEAYPELDRLQNTLEQHYREMQDVEFTVERGRLYILQTRAGQCAAAAAVRMAVDMADEGLIDRETAVMRVDAAQLDQLLHRQISPDAQAEKLANGLPASPGAAAGRAVFDPDTAQEMGEAGEEVILVRRETSPDDFHGMAVSSAIVTSRGGMTSHAAVVARGMGKPCIVGATNLDVRESEQLFHADGQVVREGDWITVDGTTGRILLGQVPTVQPEPSDQLHKLMEWADSYRTLNIRTNADTPDDARKAREFGAEGIGLCRTEHMFFEGGRILAVRRMILASSQEERQAALDKLLPMQREDFSGIFRVMAGLPVTIRLLDPPLHEFLPWSEEETRELAGALDIDHDQLVRQLEKHREQNPMLGHRGVRLGISFPEVVEMQARAIFEAAVQVAGEGVQVIPEIMVPLVGDVAELRHQTELINRIAEQVMEDADVSIPYLVGTMIELPRATVTAGSIAEEADFFSFGTNDLTQTVYGISRDDAGTFLPHYLEEKLLPDDPFQVLDQEGVGRLVELACREGRATKPDLKLGICGEHGGEPSSVEFFHRAGLDYVSCSPYRVPVARLAAAHAALRERSG